MNADAVAAQIKKRNYPAAIKEFGGEILLVGINYDKDALSLYVNSIYYPPTAY